MKNRLKKFIFICIPLLVVLVIGEGVVRLLRIPALQDEAYFFGFYGCPKYFEKIENENGEIVYTTNPDKDIQLTSFPVHKPENAYRIFTLGGSAAYGEPFGPEGSFSRWLQDRLSFFYPEKQFEVVNCARRGFGSVRVRNIFDEVVGYDPDLIVVYFGNNEDRDYRFHRIEINIEIRPFFKTVKYVKDHSHIFRMLFHLFFKKHTTSFGAENIREVTHQGQYDEDIFSKHVKSVLSSRRRLDVGHGGEWVSKLDPNDPFGDEDFDEVFRQLNGRNELPEKFTMIFERNVKHMVAKCREKRVPILFLTRGRNLYFNRDDRLLFDRYDAANGVIRKVCTEERVPFVETLRALLRSFHDEIGYNAFIDDVHPTMRAHQVMAKEIVSKMMEDGLMNPIDSGAMEDLEKTAAIQEEEARTEFPFCSEYYALLGWQKLVMMEASDDPKRAQEEIIALANRALEIDPDAYHNYLSYILLGTLYSMTGDAKKTQEVWETMKEKYSGWK